MASTVNQVIAKFRQHYNDCPADYALNSLFPIAHREILTRAQVRNVSRAISMTEGVQLYDSPDGTEKIHEAYYQRSSSPNEWLNLMERSTDYYEAVRRGWRMIQNQSEPNEYYVTSGIDGDSAKMQIGFFPIPNITTDPSSGYPRVQIWTTEYADLSGTDTIPSNLISDLIYVYIMCRQWAVEQHNEDISKWITLLEGPNSGGGGEMDKNVKYVKNVQTQSNSLIVGPVYTATRVI